MDLIIDANILMSALIAVENKTFDLIFDSKLVLSSPEFLLEEFEKHKDEILKKSGLSKEYFDLFFSLISSEITFVPLSGFKKYVKEAKKITPDPNDTEYIALALKLDCAIWSNDRRLKDQDKVKVLSTSELLKLP